MDDIITILKTPINEITPTLQIGDSTRNAILKIATALKTSVQPPLSPAIHPSPLTIPVPESRVVVPQPQPVSESRVILPQDNSFPSSSTSVIDDDDTTVKTSNTFTTKSNLQTSRSQFDGKRVYLPGPRFSQRLHT
mgnify:CR=1 FL=1